MPHVRFSSFSINFTEACSFDWRICDSLLLCIFSTSWAITLFWSPAWWSILLRNFSGASVFFSLLCGAQHTWMCFGRMKTFENHKEHEIKAELQKHFFFEMLYIFFLSVLLLVLLYFFFIKVLYLLCTAVNGFESIIIVSVCHFHHTKF